MKARPAAALAALALLAGACAPAAGQLAEPGSPIRPERECQSVAQILGPAHPEPVASRFLKRIQACASTAGPLVAGEIRSLRASSDTAWLEEVGGLTRYLHDASVIEAALEVAADRAASGVARVHALRTLVWSMAPGHQVGFEHMVRGETVSWSTSVGHFYGGYTADDLSWPAIGRPAPEGYVERIHALCARVAADEAEPADVRAAARATCRWRPDPELVRLLAERR